MLYRVDGEDLTAIANAIRAKAETTETLTFPQGFADAIDAIQTGGDGTSTILVSVETGSTVTLTHGGDVTQGTEENGLWTFAGCAPGDYTITATKGNQSASQSVRVEGDYSQLVVYYVTLTYNTIPAFTYTGDYEVVDDNDNPITTSTGNWKIRLLTSGTLTITDTHGNDAMDIFLVGGGGSGGGDGAGSPNAGGGGGGYTLTLRNKELWNGYSLPVTIGAGGAGVGDNKDGNAGGQTSFGIVVVDGGQGGKQNNPGGNGGSGGGKANGGNGGSDGSNGGNGGGTGQGTTTREFGEAGGRLYAGGGGAYGSGSSYGKGGAGGGGDATGTTGKNGSPGQPNTGGGGGGECYQGTSGAGGSGIVIIRNARG